MQDETITPEERDRIVDNCLLLLNNAAVTDNVKLILKRMGMLLAQYEARITELGGETNGIRHRGPKQNTGELSGEGAGSDEAAAGDAAADVDSDTGQAGVPAESEPPVVDSVPYEGDD